MILFPAMYNCEWYIFLQDGTQGLMPATKCFVDEPFKPANGFLQLNKNINLGRKISFCKMGNIVSCVHVLFFNHLFKLSASTLMVQ